MKSDDQRHVLIKIVQSDSSATRDRVIKATNSQTGVQLASLRATDAVQRDIEEALVKHSLYYDRQKNFYKNEGRPLKRIIGIAEMAQTVMSILLQRPNDARARPSSLIKDDGEYDRIFSDEFPVELYIVAGEIKKLVDEALRMSSSINSGERNDILYYVLTRLAVVLTKKVSPQASDIASLMHAEISDEVVTAVIDDVAGAYRSLGGDEKVAKGRALVEKVKAMPI